MFNLAPSIIQMPRRQQQVAPDHLRLKLEEVNDFIRGREIALRAFESKVELAHAEQLQPDPPALLQAIRLAMPGLCLVPFSSSLIAADLQRIQSDLGERHLSDVNQGNEYLQTALDKFNAVLSDNVFPPTVLVDALLGFKDKVKEQVMASLRPALALRDEYVDQLARLQPEVPRREKKRRRNARLQWLKHQHPRATIRQLVELANEDSEIKALKEPVTKDIVREATEHQKRGKRRSKNPTSSPRSKSLRPSKPHRKAEKHGT